MCDEKVQKLCDDLDELTLKQVDLLDEQLVLISKLEGHLSSGFINLAKSRYIRGERSVSLTQIPGEDSDVEPIATLVRDSSNKLKVQRNASVNDPIKWFGVLVPGSLRQSQESFQKVIEAAVDIINARNDWLEALKEEQIICNQKNNL